jgi:hypothetical protein
VSIFLIGYPVNPIIETAAEADIRTIMVRQERTGYTWPTRSAASPRATRSASSRCSIGPGTENAYGGDRPGVRRVGADRRAARRYRRAIAGVQPNYSAFLNMQQISKSVEQVTIASAVPDAIRRAFTGVRNGRPRPTVVEIPVDLYNEEIAEPLHYRPAPRTRSGPDPQAVAEVAKGPGRRGASGDLRRAGGSTTPRRGTPCANWPRRLKRR